MNVLNECRVCFETTDQNLMVSPCHCRGSMAYIHFQCLKSCIETSGEEKCGICGQNWLGIEIVKKMKSFTDFFDKNSGIEISFIYLILFSMCFTILLMISIIQGSIIMVIVLFIFFVPVYSIFLTWSKFIYKYTVIEC